MFISVRAFASYREAIGAPSVRLDVPEGSSPGQVWDRLLGRVKHPQAGGIVLFLGTARDNDRGRHVKFIEYEAYQPMALKEMNRVVGEARRRWPLLGIAIVHRLGHLDVGDISVAIAVSSGHRKEAFEAGRYAIDTLKQTVPIWKKEVWEGGEAWIGSDVT